MSLIPIICRTQDQKPANMSFFANLSDFVYEPSSIIRQRLLTIGIDYDLSYEYFEGPQNSTQGFLLSDPENIVICFRGTEPSKLQDWLTDLDFAQIPVSYNNSRHEVHGGFWQALESVWPHISGWLKIRMKNRKIWLTGHSLGGALASLALVRLCRMGLSDNVGGLYTYGCPRSVNVSLAAEMNSLCKERVFRVVNDKDIVPHVPPGDKLLEAMDFCHFGTRVFFSQNEDVWIDEKQELWSASKNNKTSLISGIINKVFDNINLAEKIADHSRDNYCRLSSIYESKSSL